MPPWTEYDTWQLTHFVLPFLGLIAAIGVGVALACSDASWIQVSKPARLAWFPLWFAAILVLGALVVPPAFVVKAFLPRGYGVQTEGLEEVEAA